MRLTSIAGAVVSALLYAQPAVAQQRPLTTEDPEPIGAGRVLFEAGADYSKNQEYPASGLVGGLWRLPVIGLSFGISSIAELQLDGGFFNRLSIDERNPAPLADLLEVDGDTTNDVEDIVVATKIRLAAETPGRPAIAVRFATRLPNAQNESGLGLDTTDFAMSLLAAKTVQSIRVVGNLGFAILGEPTDGHEQNDVLTYGASVARAISERAELVGEINGRISTRASEAAPGTESRGLLRFGGRYTRNAIRFDAVFFIGLTSVDPNLGFGGGLTYVFNAFRIP
jgi:hypothetical protein